jgi:pimeloyl-ACP methyl ester carboxylesterase
MPYCQLQGSRLFYEERGQGEVVLFLNGLSGDHLYWLGPLRTFGKNYRCLAPDNRDVGQSDYVAAAYTVRQLADEYLEFLDRLSVSAAHIVGLSLGGMIAQELALAAPQRVHSLVLVNTLARTDDWFAGTLRAFELIRRQVPDTPAFFEAILSWWVSHRFFEGSERCTWLRWLLHQTPHSQRLDGFLRQLEAIRGHDTLDRLAGIACPTLILSGEDDGVMPPRYARQLAERLPHAELVVIPEVGHALPFEAPAAFRTHLADFLRRQSAARNRSA